MLPRCSLFRKSDRLSSTLSSRKWHFSSAFGGLQLNSSFRTCAVVGVTVFSLSTLYVLQHRLSKIRAATACGPATDSKQQCPHWNSGWDGRATNRNGAIRSYTLVRHGQYVHARNAEDKVLTDLGRQQAETTGKKLRAMQMDFDYIICSTMVRAKETAHIITKELYPDRDEHHRDIQFDPKLNEGCPAYVVPERDDLDKSGFWDTIDVDVPRISKAFETHIHRNDASEDTEVLIIGHGNVFRYFMCRVLQIPPEAWLRMSLSNCSMTKFQVFGDGRVSVECIGSNGHFPKEQRTFN